GAEGALPLWTHFMIEAHHDKPKVAFDVPENIVFKKSTTAYEKYAVSSQEASVNHEIASFHSQ
ncbi:MAG TPA: hypothetical protein VJB34_07025, partial [Bdellovibrionota bacterium]|nr:hypothetical protein [Bdellovibrionota bacterium]